jgi:hypothetical protein
MRSCNNQSRDRAHCPAYVSVMRFNLTSAATLSTAAAAAAKGGGGGNSEKISGQVGRGADVI